MREDVLELKDFENNTRYRDYFRKEVIPKYYYGPFHVLLNIFLLLGVIIFSATQIKLPSILEIITLPLMLIVGNLVVFVIHKYPLHRPIKFFMSPYNIHSKMHHQFFTDKHIVYDSHRDFYILFFPPEVVISFVFIFCPISLFLMSVFISLNVAYFFIMGAAIYFILYEVFHYASHLPIDHPLLKIPFFLYMREHHRIHHDPTLMRDYNFNIVYPLSDWLFKTIYKAPKGDS